jgi:LPXTG-motif cell wall-anchored protein
MIVLLALSVLFAVTAAAQGTGDPANGKTQWAARNCKSCHGDNGEGKYAGPRAGDGLAADVWIKQVHTPRANMPAYTTAQISDTVITDMWAYMQTLPKPASFTPVSTTVPAGALPGHQVMVDERCVACHGNVQAFVKSRFVDQNRDVTTDVVLKQLRTPARNMPMFSATQVTDPQAAQIADYLKAQTVIVKAAAQVTPTTPVTATRPVTATTPVTATKVTTPTAAAAAPATMPKTGADLSLRAQGTTTTTRPVTATAPVPATAPVTATRPVTATAPVTATKPATTTAAAAAAAPAPAPATMPKTGGEMSLLVLSGLSLLGISAGLAIRGRRR